MSAVGGIIIGAFIAAVTTVSAHLQCGEHPSETWTASGFPQVSCWHSGEASVQNAMLTMACVTALMPVRFFAFVM